MDVAKYISLFLLKNKYCQLQGLGNLELRRTTAVSSGSSLSGGSYTVNWNAAGGIDDQLPLFIAVQEGISASQASVVLNEFVAAAKSTLQSGGDIQLPGIGRFRMLQGQLSFHTDEKFSLPDGNIPLTYFNRVPLGLEEGSGHTTTDEKTDVLAETYAPYDSTQTPTNWGRIGLWVVGILVVLGIAAGILRYTVWNTNTAPSEPVNIISIDTQIDSSSMPNATIADSTSLAGSDSLRQTDSAIAAVAPVAPGSFRFILKKYKHLEAAEKRVKKLTSYGHPVKLISVNDSLHYVVEELQVSASDTTRIKDSLARLLSPEGVEIMK